MESSVEGHAMESSVEGRTMESFVEGTCRNNTFGLNELTGLSKTIFLEPRVLLHLQKPYFKLTWSKNAIFFSLVSSVNTGVLFL